MFLYTVVLIQDLKAPPAATFGRGACRGSRSVEHIVTVADDTTVILTRVWRIAAASDWLRREKPRRYCLQAKDGTQAWY